MEVNKWNWYYGYGEEKVQETTKLESTRKRWGARRLNQKFDQYT